MEPEVAPGGQYRRRLRNADLIGKPVNSTAKLWAESFSKFLVMPGTVMAMQSPGVVPTEFDVSAVAHPLQALRWWCFGVFVW